MKKLNTSNLIGKRVFVDGWQHDNSGTLLDGVVIEVAEASDQFGRLAYALKTECGICKLDWIITKGLIENGVYEADKFLNSGTNAVILEK